MHVNSNMLTCDVVLLINDVTLADFNPYIIIYTLSDTWCVGVYFSQS